MGETDKLKLAQRDFQETEEIRRILQKIDAINEKDIHAISDEIYRYQPFLISILMGDQLDFEPREVEEMMKVYFILWEYYKEKRNIKSISLTQEKFEKQQDNNIHFFRYLEAETQKGTDDATLMDLESLKSKALLSGLLLKFNTVPVFVEMNADKRATFLIGVKSLMECFEEIMSK